MKKLLFIILISFFAACNVDENKKTNKEETTPIIKNELPSDTLSTIANDTSAVVSLISYYETKQDHTRVEIEKIEKKLTPESTTEQREDVASLKEKEKKVTQKIEDFKHASAEALEELKLGIDSAYADLDRAVKRAKQKFKKNKP